jgi:uncharacterized phage protein (TIGR02220 family)
VIPKDSTPIKNKILIDIIAKGLLSKDEMRIIAYIIRWSWGFNGIGRRQDWTKKIRITKIAKDINMDRGNCNRTVLRMIRENKIKIKNGSYQFNEHCEKWEKRVKTTRNKRVEITQETCKNYTKNVYKLHTKRVKNTQLGIPNNQGDSIKNKDVKGGEHTSKETLKDNKETLKGKKSDLRFEIIRYLNKITGAHYKPNTPDTVKHIKARLKEGFTLEDFKYVIDIKCAEWKGKFNKEGKSMEDFLRPITLFGTRFESYLNQAKPDPLQKYYKKE